MCVISQIKRVAILCFISLFLVNQGFAVDYILDTPGSTTINGSGTTYVSGYPADKPDISGGLADGDTLTLTAASGGTAVENSIHRHGGWNGIRGALGQGNNTIIMESGSSILFDTSSAATVSLAVYGTTVSTAVVGIVGGSADNIVTMDGSIKTSGSDNYNSGLLASNNNIISIGGSIETTSDWSFGLGATNNNSISVGGSIETTGDYSYGLEAESFNSISVGGNISTAGGQANGVRVYNNNSIGVSGSISTTGHDSLGVQASNNNSIDVSGSIVTEGDMAHGIYAGRYKFDRDHGLFKWGGNTVTISETGQIKTSGKSADGIKANALNTINMHGSIITTGDSNGSNSWNIYDRTLHCGISALDTNKIVSTGSILVSGVGIDAIDLFGEENVVHLSGVTSSTGTGGHALVSGNNIDYGFVSDNAYDPIHKESNTFHLLNGVGITGGIHNRDSNGNGTSYLTFGYTKDGSKAAELTSVDNSFSFVQSDSITSDSTGYWDGFVAGGSTTLNGSVNQFGRIFVGADSFDGTTVADGWKNDPADVDPSDGTNRIAATVDLGSVSGAVATLTVNNSISTLNAVNGGIGAQTVNPAKVTVGSGSTYNLNGTHTHEFANSDSFNVLGTLNLGANGSIVDYQGNNTVQVTLGGVANNGAGVTVGGTLTSSATSQSLGINIFTGATCNVNAQAGTLTLSSITNSGTLNADVSSGATLKLDADAGMNTLALAGTIESGATQTINSLTVAGGAVGIIKLTAGTLTLSSVTNSGTLNADVSSGATLDIDSVVTIADLNLAGTFDSGANVGLTQVDIAGNTTGTLNVTSGTLTVSTLNNGGTAHIAVTKGARFTNSTGSAIDLTANNSALTLDFGDDTDTTIFAKTSGKFKSSGANGDTATSIYGINGVAGETYAGVFDDDITDENDDILADGTKLNNSKDTYRNYTIKNNGVSNPYDILVENNNSIRVDVLSGGGSSASADAANRMVENQGSFDQAGQAFVTQLTSLTGSNLVRGASELIGEQATTVTSQASLQTVAASAGSVRNQMTSFRTGNLASGLASSFAAGGATAATGMSDADELADAYESVDHTADQTVYRSVTVWATGFGGFGEQGSVDGMTGYDFWNAGTMVGLDYAFANELRVGGLFGYSYNKANLYENTGDSADNTLRLGAYSSYNWDNFFVDISPTMGIHMIESKRNLITNGLTAKGDRTALDFNINGTIGYTFNLPADITFTPSYSLGYTMFYDPDYTETGAAAGNLSYDSFTSNSLLQDIGIKAGKLFRVNDKLAFLPEAWGGWEVEYLNTGGNRNSTNSVSIGGGSYSTSMSSLATHRGYWGLGLTALVNHNVSVFGRYDHKIWDKGYNVGFSAGVKVSF